jgi:putative membrane protein
LREKQPRAIDNYFAPWIITVLNAAICTVLSEVKGVNFGNELLYHWDTVYTVVLKTSLAFLLVFRLNRVAIRYWETRTMWGNLTFNSRALVSGILLHLEENSVLRDRAIAWVGAYAVACMHFIRNDQEIPTEELWGFLTRPDIEKMLDSQHAPLYAATQIRRNLKKALRVSPATLPALAHARAVQMNLFEVLINDLIAQVSGMEKIRSTPLPIVYVAHLRTFLFLYLLSLPYIYVGEWGWATIGLVGFTAFALLGIEGASTECEVPFNKSRCNHLALDAYCLIILENIQGLVVQDANMDMGEKQNSTEKDDILSHRRTASQDHNHPLHRKTGSFDIASCIHEVIPEQN